MLSYNLHAVTGKSTRVKSCPMSSFVQNFAETGNDSFVLLISPSKVDFFGTFELIGTLSKVPDLS